MGVWFIVGYFLTGAGVAFLFTFFNSRDGRPFEADVSFFLLVLWPIGAVILLSIGVYRAFKTIFFLMHAAGIRSRTKKSNGPMKHPYRESPRG